MIMWYLTHARRHPSSEATWAAWLILVGGGGVEVEVEVAEREERGGGIYDRWRAGGEVRAFIQVPAK